MGSVLAFKPAPSKDFIAQAYDRLVDAGGFSLRPEQEQLSRGIAASLLEGQPYAAEAPTGTGKTLAYLVALLAVRQVTGSPVVVATATVALQEQILTNDLPRLAKLGIIDPKKFSVIKGRGRYFCAKSAQRFIDANEDATSQSDMFNAEAAASGDDLKDVQTLLADWQNERWNGDSDTLKGKVPKVWRIVKASSDTCLNKKCDMYDNCQFFKDRAQLAYADVIVANHDLVLADLAMAQEGKETLFPIGDYALAFDEAHHLADKAIKLGEAELDLMSADGNLVELEKMALRAFRLQKLAASLRRKNINVKSFDYRRFAQAIAALRKALLDTEFAQGTKYFLFKNKEVPAALTDLLKNVQGEASLIEQNLSDLVQVIRQSKPDDKDAAQESAVLFEATGWLARFKDMARLTREFSSDKNLARWLDRADDEEGNTLKLALRVSPLDGVELLKKVLWDNPRAIPALVSATLRDTEGTLKRFAAGVGMPEGTKTQVFPYVLPYKNSTLHMPAMTYTPKDAGFQKEMEAKLVECIDTKEGTLMLFNSRAMMVATSQFLIKKFGEDAVLIQDSMGMQELLTRHKERIDSGKGSILLGVQKMAEGLDLPGKYCTHVIISRLPFAVPDSPVEAERQSQVGSRYFSDFMVPDTLLRLVQMVGRLVRREDDIGRITMLDSRLRGTAWGRKMLNVLPPFKHA